MAQIGVSQAISRQEPKRVLDYGLETGYGFTSLKGGHMETRERDKQAWDAHQSGMTWAGVARLMHYANGSVARRAAMRHGGDAQTEPTLEVVAPDITVPEETPEPAGWVQKQHEFVATWEGADKPLADLKEGDLVYHHLNPKATFSFVKWNADGSAQVWGGNFGFAAYRDWHTDKLSRMPASEDDLILHWASENLFEHVTIDRLIQHLGVNRSAVRRVTTDRPDVFRRIERGLFEVRNPQADRTADKVGAS